MKIYADNGGIVDGYLGLPYAAAPIANLRFASPQKHPGWNGTFQAVKYGSSCPQLPLKKGVSENEDCLLLNIWAPETALRYPLPVVMYLDGEEFAKGNRFPVSGRDLAMEEIVVVTVNYRLNVFGFLCFENQQMRGNMGLLDQYFAMLWVRENIRYFGGDPDKVTLFGHSAGAASVALHMISPRTAGYFQRIIMSSGSALSPWHLTLDAKTASLQIATILGCRHNYYSSIIQCLRSKTTEQILEAYEEYKESVNSSSALLPVIDTFLPENDRYLPVSPEKAFKSGTYMQVPILAGISRPIYFPHHERWIFLVTQGYVQLRQYMETSKIPEILRRYGMPNREQLTDLIKWKYISSSNGDALILLEELKSLEFTSKIEAPHYLQLQYLLSSYVQPIYVYYLENNLNFNVTNIDLPISLDLLLLFGPLLLKDFIKRDFNARELRFSQHVKQLWKNFVIFGNPTPNNYIKNWKRYNSVENYIEYLGAELEKDEAARRTRRVSFWNQLLPKISILLEERPSTSTDLQNVYIAGGGYRHALYTLSGLIVALLILLLICIVLIKKRAKERERQFQMVY